LASLVRSHHSVTPFTGKLGAAHGTLIPRRLLRCDFNELESRSAGADLAYRLPFLFPFRGGDSRKGKRGDIKMKRLKTILLILGAAAGPAALSAQTKAVADIPFAFTVSTVTMPPGEYVLEATSPAGDMLRLINKDTGKSISVLAPRTNTAYRGDATATGAVIFHRYGDQRFFSEVWTPGGLHQRVLPGKLEKERNSKGQEAKLATISVPVAGLK
jgi:hypothetical protein